ncbi:large-conductance mechanosensitive channel protein MscL [Candidatus Gracilibacteria bacterium]|nr:large-conductance mechanosensitive channel protein MscL [Candidatus Gracilibacteria bacterium]
MKALMSDFRDFLIKGNAIDMAVAFMFGAAFGVMIKSFVDNIIMPPIGMLLGKVDFSNLFISLDGNTYATIAALEEAGAPAIKYGQFITDSISFVILGFIIFMMIRAIAKLKRAEEQKISQPAPIPQDIVLLTEIRDALKK